MSKREYYIHSGTIFFYCPVNIKRLRESLEASYFCLNEKKTEIKTLKDNKIKMDDDERQEAIKAKCVWHPVNHDKPVCAIWKSKDSKGKTWYCSNTHRAYAKSPTLKGAIKKFPSIKDTA